jgi:hypothetical protein
MILNVSEVSPLFQMAVAKTATCQATRTKKIMHKKELIPFMIRRVRLEYRVAKTSIAIWLRVIWV